MGLQSRYLSLICRCRPSTLLLSWTPTALVVWLVPGKYGHLDHKLLDFPSTKLQNSLFSESQAMAS